jgi:hypothetical protein
MTPFEKCNERERQAAERFQKLGLRVEPCTTTFYLDNEVRYTPDLYLPDLNTFVEVIGSRQAHSLNQHKYIEVFAGGAANFMLTTHDGHSLYPTKLRKPTCNVLGCLRSADTVSIGPYDRLCGVHRRRLAKFGIVEEQEGCWRVLRKKFLCAYPGCSNYMMSYGFCKAHGDRVTRYGLLRKPKPKCIGPGCDRPQTVKGMCVSHYYQQRRYGQLRVLSQRSDRRVNIANMKEAMKGNAGPMDGEAERAILSMGSKP